MGREGRGGGVVRPARESVGFAIAGALSVCDVVVVGRQGSSLPSMAAGGGSRTGKVFQVLVVRENTDRVGSALHVHPPLPECLHHREQLLVVDRVV